MNAWVLRLAGAGLLILLGITVGARATTHHFRPLLDDQQAKVAQCTAARDNLAGLATEQGKAIGDLMLAAAGRQAAAEQVVKTAEVGAKADYAAANRLQQERTGGDQCAAATSIIDKELGL
ncbi:hypothetical protein [Pseudomonas shirazensis]|uniref:hypothetical protein n=1 Tax=Pseudomonas shirazensis TaxID=2745494 RepID=UPI001648BFE4|nr:hypothetical protein [Pseudomonas shirazensis]MBV4500353.1 hypothetical protein [Pseudomonas shirazensis]